MFWFKRRKPTEGVELDLSGKDRGSLLGITCVGKRDGGGAQVHAVMSALLFSRANGIPYFHSPFEGISHGGNPKAFAAQWERAFNLGLGAPKVPKRVPVISSEEFNQGYRGAPAIVAAQNFHSFAERNLGFYPALADELRDRVVLPPRKFETPTIAVHIRRGDVIGNAKYTHRLTDNALVLANIKHVLGEHPHHRVLVFSEGTPADFGPLAEFCDFELNSDVFSTISAMIQADCLIMAKSSLSYVAGLLSRGSVYYEPFWHGPLPSWRVLPNSE